MTMRSVASGHFRTLARPREEARDMMIMFDPLGKLSIRFLRQSFVCSI